MSVNILIKSFKKFKCARNYVNILQNLFKNLLYKLVIMKLFPKSLEKLISLLSCKNVGDSLTEIKLHCYILIKSKSNKKQTSGIVDSI